MNKYLALLLIVSLALTGLCALAEEEEDDFSIAGFITEEVMLDDEGNETVVAAPKSIYEDDGSVLLTLTFTGDFTIGGDSRKRADIFNDELKRQGGDINFTMRNIRDVLLADDLTTVNFEGTLTDSTYVPSNKKNNQFLFSAPPEYVSMLTDNGIEAVALDNNHIMDHGEEAFNDTWQTLENAGLIWSHSTNFDHIGEVEVKGVRIGMLAYFCIDRYDKLWDKVPMDIALAKEAYDLVIVSFHWGNELDYSPTNNQIKMGRLAVDAGADLVVGHHSHRMNPIEQYKGVYICYSLGNFCFSGNSKPSDMTSFVFQTQFRKRGETITNEGFRIIPIRISSRTDRNDFIPTILTKDTAIDSVLTTLKANGRKLQYAVEEYPLEFE